MAQAKVVKPTIGRTVRFTDVELESYPGIIVRVDDNTTLEERVTLNIFTPFASMSNIVKTNIRFNPKHATNPEPNSWSWLI